MHEGQSDLPGAPSQKSNGKVKSETPCAPFRAGGGLVENQQRRARFSQSTDTAALQGHGDSAADRSLTYAPGSVPEAGSGGQVVRLAGT